MVYDNYKIYCEDTLFFVINYFETNTSHFSVTLTSEDMNPSSIILSDVFKAIVQHMKGKKSYGFGLSSGVPIKGESLRIISLTLAPFYESALVIHFVYKEIIHPIEIKRLYDILYSLREVISYTLEELLLELV